MKKSLATAFLFSLMANLFAQDAPPQDTPFAIVQNDANSRVWERTTYEQLPTGTWIPHVHRYQEMATGLNYKDPNTGQWQESVPVIEQIQGGAVAQQGQHKVVFAADLATVGAIDLETPDGKQLQTHMLGLSYLDRSSGQSVFIAQVTNSIGQLISSNQVWYDDAFTGLKAGVRYTYTREGFEQDVILEEQPLAPEAYGLKSSTTVLQAFTEFISPPAPVIRTSQIPGGQLSDETLSFGTMRIGRGCAFLAGQDSLSCPVCKTWVTLENRQFLVEEIPVAQISAQLQSLPQQASLRASNSVLNVVSKQRLLPARPLAKAGKPEMKIAKLATRQPGFVIDYTSVNTTLTNYTFQGDTTYYISGNLAMYGTATTFEGGTVMKYASNVTLTVNSPINWYGQNYRPVVMLSKDDNTMGDTISGSTGNPSTNYYAVKALYFDGDSAFSSLAITNLRVLNARSAVVINGQSGHILSDVQLVKCSTGIAATNTDFSLRNALMSQVLTNFTGTNTTGVVEHLTSDTAIWLNKDIGANLYLTNCLLSAVANLGSCATQNVSSVSSGSGVFQTVGAGSYYLANNSIYRNAGTTNINPDLRARLAKKTTYPPTVCVSSNFSFPTTLGPQIQRDTDVPDLGFHYDPMDYVLSQIEVSTNLTIAPGTAIGWFRTNGNSYAVHLADKQILTFAGTFETPDYFVRNNTAQEGNGLWVGNGAMGIAGTANQFLEDVTLSPELRMNFTMMYGFVGWDHQFQDSSGYLIVRANNSVLAGGNVTGYVISLYLTNCLMDNQQLGQIQGHTGNEVYLRNCTLHNGYYYGLRSMDIPINVKDSSFDGVVINATDAYASDSVNTVYNYNAYTNGTDPFPNPTGTSHDQASVSFNWQMGPLGRFYLPFRSALVDVGHTTADLVGLYHFTTQNSANSPETNSIVDIGYHYVALDDNGNPIDTDGDGTPDYLEDANGNGLVDSGETDWQSATDLGLKVIITRPTSTSVIP